MQTCNFTCRLYASCACVICFSHAFF